MTSLFFHPILLGPLHLARLRSVFRCPPSFLLWAGPGSPPSQGFIGGQFAQRGCLHRLCWQRLGLLFESVRSFVLPFCICDFPMCSLSVHIIVPMFVFFVGFGIYAQKSKWFQSFLVGVRLGLRTCSKALIYCLGDVSLNIVK